MTTFNQFMIMLGILIAYVADFALEGYFGATILRYAGCCTNASAGEAVYPRRSAWDRFSGC